MSAITALTAQNTLGVQAIHGLPPEFVKAQLDSVLSDLGVDAIKTGMLHTVDVIQIVSERLSHYSLKNIVVDPVMIAKSGHLLIEEVAIDALRKNLIPLARVLTPNLPEASKLLGQNIKSDDEIESAAKKLAKLGPEAVILKGGHRKDGTSDDCLFVREANSKETIIWLRQKRIETPNIHGTGCTFSSAIAAFLARSVPLNEAIQEAKNYITGALESSGNKKIGKGYGPVDHFFQTRR